MKRYFGKTSIIAADLATYEFRKQQLDMAEAVDSSIRDGKNLLAEAGCGVGKSFAYLVPLILWATREKDRRAVISTYTKTLQQQLIEKDLPMLKKTMGIDFKFALCVGSRNYLCLNRFGSVFQDGLLDTAEEQKEMEDIVKWSEVTPDGLSFNLHFKVSEALWADICRLPEFCTERRCVHYNSCFYFRAKKAQAESDIMVLNHHLLFTDIASGWMILPQYHAIVFDEAQNVEDVASSTLGIEVSNRDLRYMLNRIYKKRSSRALLNRTGSITPKQKDILKKSVEYVRSRIDNFFTAVYEEYGGRGAVKRIQEPGLFPDTPLTQLKLLGQLLEQTAETAKNENTAEEFKSFARLCKAAAADMGSFINMKLDNHVYFIQTSEKHGHMRCSMKAYPVDVSQHMDKLVFQQVSPVILTSATLTVDGKFDFIRKRLGIEDSREIVLDSPYDYGEKVLLYMPENIPDPSYSFDSFSSSLTDHISEVLEITGGRTFVLFTSYDMLNKAADELLDRFTGLNFLIHGELPRKKLLEHFINHENSVLLGTSTFWQGVDIPGRNLECVIITKLPFAAPDEPVTEARMEHLKQEGLDPFTSYQVPLAVLMFKQGFGRLIRHRRDFGIVAVFDPRIKTREYGKAFMEALPQCRQIKKPEELGQEYERLCRESREG